MRRCRTRTMESVLKSHGPRESLERSIVRIGLETYRSYRERNVNRYCGWGQVLTGATAFATAHARAPARSMRSFSAMAGGIECVGALRMTEVSVEIERTSEIARGSRKTQQLSLSLQRALSPPVKKPHVPLLGGRASAERGLGSRRRCVRSLPQRHSID